MSTSPADPPPVTRWEQVEPRRRYRATINGQTSHLIYQGRDAVGPDLPVGWYLESAPGRPGHRFMARRLQDAADAATRQLTDR